MRSSTASSRASTRLLLSLVLTLVATVVAVLALGTSPAAAAVDEPDADVCADQVRPSWDQVTTVDGVVTVGVAILDLPGCTDGEVVGLQLLLDDQLVPDERLHAVVTDGRARFDLTPFDIPVAPVTGVQVTLVDASATIAIDVERRYLNPAGNEQVGLASIERRELAPGSTYTVASERAGYVATDCDAAGITATSGPVVAEGAGGPFTAATPGTHLACFQQVPGPPAGPGGPGGPGGGDGTEVLGEVIERDGVAGAGGGSGTAGPGGGAASAGDGDTEVLSSVLRRLPVTGDDLTRLAALAGGMLGAGVAALSWRRRRSGSATR